MREQIDCTKENLAAVLKLFPLAEMWGGYDTGSSTIQYLDSDWTKVTAPTKVHIDQGFNSPVITTATVRDVEPNAWIPENAVRLGSWHAERPTIYCDRSDLFRKGGILDLGWTGDLWVAIPSTSAPLVPIEVPHGNVVAIQWDFRDPRYDRSIVFDDYWPHNPPSAMKWKVDMVLLQTPNGNVYTFDGSKLHHIADPVDVTNFKKVLSVVPVSSATFTKIESDIANNTP